MEGKIPSISGLAKTSALTDGVNEIPSVSNLVKKADYDTKLLKLRRNLQIIIMINILLHLCLII